MSVRNGRHILYINAEIGDEERRNIMKISGLQKLTLLDYPEKTACTIFTCGCNFRCPFCHNASLVTHTEDAGELDEEKLMAFLEKRRGILDGVCITGGEPLLWDDLDCLLAKIKELGYLIKLDTNGSSPKRLKELAQKGLIDYVAMDIKNARERYGETIGIPGYDTSAVEQSVKWLLEGHLPYEFRTTIVREFHKKEDISRIGEWLLGAEKYYLQKFEDSEDVVEQGLHSHTDQWMKEAGELAAKYMKNVYLRGIV